MNIAQRCKEMEGYVIGLRRELHMHPNLPDQEAWTVSRIMEELGALEISYEKIPGIHGVVGKIQGERPGRAIALRADIDALPVQEQTGLPYQSQVAGVMHACGHDGNAAMLLGAAAILSELRAELEGTILLCFQPGEEVGHGADEIIEYLEGQGGVGQVVALHIWNDLPVGQILLLDGTAQAGGAAFNVHAKGQGGHGSRPDLVRDPVKAVCDLVLKMASLPSNFYDMLSPCAVHSGVVRAGTACNIFPDDAFIESGVRYYKQEGLEEAMGHIRRMAEGVGRIYDVEMEVEIHHSLAPVVNHHEPVMRARAIVPQIEGLTLNPRIHPLSAADNFCYFLEKYPGVYAYLGCKNEEKGLVWPQHHAKFDIDEDELRKGCEFLVRYALDYLK